VCPLIPILFYEISKFHDLAHVVCIRIMYCILVICIFRTLEASKPEIQTSDDVQMKDEKTAVPQENLEAQ